jgi:HSP20 family protein
MNANQVSNRPGSRSVLSRYPLVWDFDQVMNHFFGEGTPGSRMVSERSASDGWVPAWEVVESDREFRVILDLPGFSSDDVSVELKQDLLTITGQRHETKVEEKNHVHVRERKFGKFQRVLAFREPVENQNVSAELSNGVLTVIVPKAQEAQAKKIDIRTA